MVRKVMVRRPGPGRPELTPEEKRKPRSFKATDEEWAEIQSRAAEANLSAGEYIRQKTLGAD
ncbi:MAG: hypothetical protein ABFD04_11700 [Syntrophomonas sp.]